QAGGGGGVAEQFTEQLVQVQAVGAQVPFQVDAIVLVHPADAQALKDVGFVQLALPQAPVVLGLAVLEARGGGRVAEDGRRCGIGGQVRVEHVDEGVVEV